MLENIFWLGHDGFKIKADQVIYIDPWRIGPNEPADIILVSHEHADHCSPDDIAKLAKEDTVIVASPQAAGRLRGDVRTLRPGESLEVKGVTIEAVPAYNVNKFRSPGVAFHPQADHKLGFVVTAGGTRIYHAGDTDLIPEMDGLKVDIALLPVGGTFVMTPEEAAQAAQRIKPQYAIPMHYGTMAGSEGAAARFKELCPVLVEIKVKS